MSYQNPLPTLEVSQIIDFTSLLKYDPRITIFNPCIVHYTSDLYLCCYRIHTSFIDDSPYLELKNSVYGDPNHPWRVRWRDGNARGDLPVKLLNTTKFAMLRIKREGAGNNYTIELVKEYIEAFNDIIPFDPNLSQRDLPAAVPPFIDTINLGLQPRAIITSPNFLDGFHYIGLQDARLCETPIPGLFFITGNKSPLLTENIQLYRENQDLLQSVQLENEQKTGEGRICNQPVYAVDPLSGTYLLNPDGTRAIARVDGCFIIYIGVIRIDPETLKINIVQDPIPLCPSFAARIDKNWSLIAVSNPANPNLINLTISYQIREITKGHEYFRTGYDVTTNTFGLCQHATLQPSGAPQNLMINRNPSNVQLLEKRLSFYNMLEYAFNNYVKISTTTPTIPWSNNQLISVGHVKIAYNEILNPVNGVYFDGTPIKLFVLDVQKRIRNFHWDFIYLFFFYTLDRQTLNLTSSSNFYLPQPANVSLVFPMGFTRLGGNEGEIAGDNFCLSYGDYDNHADAMILTYENINNTLVPLDNIGFLNNLVLNWDQSANNGLGGIIINNWNTIQGIIRSGDFFRYTNWVNGINNKVILK